jgi:hypothetical protein
MAIYRDALPEEVTMLEIAEKYGIPVSFKQFGTVEQVYFDNSPAWFVNVLDKENEKAVLGEYRSN